jgi:phage N-6-adenine-methyltransferase
MVHVRNEFITTPKDEMRTPVSLFKKLDERFHFDCDVAATEDNTLCNTFFAKAFSNKENPLELHKIPFEVDAIAADWCSHLRIGCRTFYCNPPYNRVDLPRFVQKGYEESVKGATVVMLLPVDFSAKWWNYCMKAAEWIRIKGRIHFNGVDNQPIKGSPFFSSVIVVFDTKLLCKNGFKLSEISWK